MNKILFLKNYVKSQSVSQSNDKGKKNAGFTLIEMVIAVALVSIFFTAAASLVPSWFRSYNRIMNVSYASQIADNVMGAVEQQLRFANNIQVQEPSAEDPIIRLTGKNRMGRFTLPMEDTHNMIDGFIYDEKFFIHNDISLDFKMSSDHSYCIVTVRVQRDGEQILEKSRAVMLAGEN